MSEEKRETMWPEDEREIVCRYVPPEREVQEVVCRYEQPIPLPRSIRPAVEEAPKKKKSRRGLWIFLACLGVLAVIAGAAAIGAATNHYGDDTPPGDDDSNASSIAGSAAQIETTIPVLKAREGLRLEVETGHGEELTVQEVYARVNPAVVTVVAEEEVGASVGTGVLMSEDGYFVTNAHIIDGASSCWIILASGHTYDAELVGYDGKQDIAVMKALGAEGLPVARFGNSDTVQVGDKVYAIGNPLGMELRGTLTDGIISAVNRSVDVAGRAMTLMQTNAALNSGNSGGPLINVYGQVIGINTMKMTGVNMEATVEGLGFSLPISDVSFVVNDILATGAYRGAPSIGITVTTLFFEDGTSGVFVYEVIEGMSGAGAGLQPGDEILAADGVAVYKTADLLAIRRNHVLGETITLTVGREGRVFDVEIELTASKE